MKRVGIRIGFLIFVLTRMLYPSILAGQANCSTGYIPAPLSTSLSVNGNFATTSGTTNTGGLSWGQNPASVAGTLHTSLGFYSQARRCTNNAYPSCSYPNEFCLGSGSHSWAGGIVTPNPFPGDPSNNVPAVNTWFYSNGNSLTNGSGSAAEYLLWGQTVAGMVVGRNYTFSCYVNNAIDPPINASDDPIIRLRIGGAVDLPNGTAVAGPITLTEAMCAPSQPMNGWIRISYSFTATSTSEIFKVTNAATGPNGDDFNITGITVVQCIPNVEATSNGPICLGGTLNLKATTQASGRMTYSWTGPNGYTDTGTSPIRTNVTSAYFGNYIVTITDSTGLTNTDTVLVSSTLGNIVVNAGADKSVCLNSTTLTLGGSPTASGGKGSYTYVWSPSVGLSANNVSNPTILTDSIRYTSYYVLITDSVGCIAKDTVSVAINPLPTASAGTDQRVCKNVTTFTIGGSPTAGGGTSPYSYLWSPSTNLSSSTTSNPSVNTSNTGITNYIIQVMDSKGCQSQDTIQVTIDTLPKTNAGRDTAICLNQTTIIGSSSTSGINYSWSPTTNLSSSTTSNPLFTANTSGSFQYILQATDNATGCISRDTINLTVHGLPTANAGLDKSRVNCIGDSVQIGSGSTSGMSYSWSPTTNLTTPSQSQTYAKPSTTTSYILWVTNTTTGCQNRDTVQVTVTSSTVTASAGTDQRVCKNATTFTLGGSPTAGGGTSPYSYLWSPSANLSSTTTSNPSVNTSNTGITNYIIQVTDSKGCQSQDTIKVTIDTLPKTNAGRDTAICLNQTTSIGQSSTTGITYTWSPATNLSNSSISNPIYTGTTSGSFQYIIQATDNATGCISRDTVTITVHSLPTANAGLDKSRVNCIGDSVQIGSGSTSGMSYSWSPTTNLTTPSQSQTYAKPITTTSYILWVTNTTTGCQNRDTVQVTVTSSTVTASAGTDQRVCKNATTFTLGGSPTAGGGTSPYSYLWSPSANLSSTTTSNPSVNTSNTGITNYIIQVTDSKGCQSQDTIQVTIDTLPKTNAGRDTAICLNQTTSIGQSSTTGITYTWSPTTNLSNSSISNPIYTGTTSGSFQYILQATDNATGCISRDTVTITVHSLPTANAGLDKSRVNCIGDSVQIGSGSTSGMSYSWSPTTNLTTPSQSQTYAKPITTTSYILWVTNTTTGCQNRDTVQVTVTSSTVTASAGTDQRVCKNATTFTLGGSPTAGGGTSPYSYLWSPSANLSSTTTSNPSVNTSNTGITNYIIQVTDSKGCQSQDTIKVTIDTLPKTNAGRDTAICLNQTTSIGQSSTTGITYTWSPTTNLSNSSISNPIYTGTTSGSFQYIIQATDNVTGCISRDTINLTVHGLSTANAGLDKSRVNCIGDSVQIGSGSTSGMSYSWSPTTNLTTPSQSQTYAKPITTTSYILWVTNTTTGCQNRDTVQVTVTSSTVTASAGTDQRVCKNATTFTIGGSPTAGGGTSPYSYLWSPSANLSSTTTSNPSVNTSNTGITNYIIQVTDSKGCQSQDTIKVTIDTLPKTNAGRDTAICLNQTTIIGSSSASGINYSWSPTTNLSSSTTSNPLFTANTSGSFQYILQATDNATGCISRDTMTITVHSLPTANAGLDKSRVNCIGDSVQIGSGSTSGMSYSWSPTTNLTTPSQSQTYAKPSTTTSYILWVTNTTTGCQNRDTVQVTVTSSTVTASAGRDTILCQNSPAIQLGGLPTAVNGLPPYTYNWSGINLSSNSSSNPMKSTSIDGSQTHELTVYDSKGCIAKDTVIIVIRSKPNVLLSASRDTICLFDSTRINVTIVSTSAPISTITWSPIGSGYSFSSSPSVSTKYFVNLMDTNQCASTDSISIIVVGSTKFLVDAGRDTTLCLGEAINLGGTPTAMGGAGVYQYFWSDTLSPIANPKLIAGVTKSYYLKVMSSVCIGFDTIKITVNSLPVVGVNSSTSKICQGDSLKLFVSSITGSEPFGYKWSNGRLDSAMIESPMSSMTYILTVSDANNCRATDSVSIIVNPNPIVHAGLDATRVNCVGDSVQLGAPSNSGELYFWTPNTAMDNPRKSNPWVKPTISTLYYLEVINSITGCKAYDSVLINVVESNLSTTKMTRNLRCFNEKSGELTISAVNGYPPYLYKTNSTSFQTGNTILGLDAMSGRYTVQDSKGCMVEDTFTIAQPDEIQLAQASIKDLRCHGIPEGEIEVKVSGGILPYQYQWDKSPSTTNLATQLYAGVHQVSVTDFNNCLKSKIFNLSQPEKLYIETNIKTNLCAGDSNGTIRVQAFKGSAPYRYLWGIGDTVQMIEGLTAGNYALSIVDSKNCLDTFSIELDDPNKLYFDSITVHGFDCDQSNAGEIIFDGAIGGTPQYTFSIDSGKTYSLNRRFLNLDTGNYSVWIRDRNQCLANKELRIKPTPSIDFEVYPRDTVIHLGESVTLNFTVTKGDKSIIQSLLWSPSEGLNCVDCESPIASPYSPKTYTLTLGYSNNCSISKDLIIRIISDDELYIPNAFSPTASEAENREIKVYSKNILTAKLMIFNRWGEKVFESDEAHIKGWNGIFNGTESPMDVYTYYAIVTYLDKRKVERKGSVTLVH